MIRGESLKFDTMKGQEIKKTNNFCKLHIHGENKDLT